MDKDAIKQAAEKHKNKIAPPFDALIDLAGYDLICALSDLAGGAPIYIPGKRNIFGGCIAAAAADEYDGTNLKALAKKYGYSTRHMNRFVNK